MKCAACGYEYKDGKMQLEKNVGQFVGILVLVIPGRDDGPTAIPLYVCPSCRTVRAE